jgi:4-hydroxybenzoyl-CoA reductase alpha subunit
MTLNDSGYSYIGKRISRTDARSIVTGEAKYLDDFKVPGMLFGKILRSPHPHAKILGVDIRPAENMPGVEAVITAEHTEKVKFCHMPVTPNKMALNDERVRFLGDEVAAVAAVDLKTAEEALRLINVDYEVLPAVFDPEEAMSPGAPQIYDDCENNIAGHFLREFGDIEKGFADADYIFEDRFSTPLVPSCTLEPHGCIASFDSQGTLTFWVTTQNPSNYQRALSQVLKIPQNKIRVIRTHVGGAFGNKSVILPQDPIAAFLAKKAGRPVKILNTREEEFATSRGRYAMIVYLKSGVKKDGTITARQAKVITNNGAYNNKGTAITALTCNRIGNLYQIPNSRTEAFIVYTNNQYGGALRGWGGPQAHFAVESQMDIIAEALNMDPLDLRLKNANQPGDTTPWGWKITSCGLTECLKAAAKEVDWKGKRSQSGPRGVGIASVLHTGAGSAGTHGAGNFAEVLLKINSDGSVNAILGESDIGQGSDTVISQIIGEVLGVKIEDITITTNNTDVIPPTMGTWGSKVTFITGNATKIAAEEAKEELLGAASEMMDGADVSDLMVSNGKIYKRSSPQESVSLRDTALYCLRKYGKPVTAKAVYHPPNCSPPDPKTGYGNYCPTYSFGAQAAEVEVDPETGKVRVLKVCAAHDVGRAINPMLVEGQIQGGVAMGIGFALYEGAKWKQGETLNRNFGTYKIMNSTEMPLLSERLIETIDPAGPFEAKGIGELPSIPTAPAIANAIQNAVGVRIKDLPITPEKILQQMKKLR